MKCEQNSRRMEAKTLYQEVQAATSNNEFAGETLVLGTIKISNEEVGC